MTAARGFARYLAGIDAGTEVPPLGLMPHRQRWRRPFIYSPADIDAVMSQARTSIASPLRAATYDTLIGLLAATGCGSVRRSSSTAATSTGTDGSAADPRVEVRQVPAGSPARQHHAGAHRVRRAARTSCSHDPKEPSFFVSLTRKRLSYAVVSQTFRQLVDDAGVGAGAPSPPRLHDLRHTFAVRTLLGWYRSGEDVQAKIPSLSTYLGHREPASTYWYLSAAPELLALAAARQRHRMVGGPVMTLIAPTLQIVLHRPARPATPGQPPHHRGLPRHPAAAAEVRAPPDRQAARPARLGRPGRHRDLRVPEPPGTRTAQQHQDPQRPADRDPLAVLLRGPAPPRARAAHPARAGHPAETVRQADRDLPDPSRRSTPSLAAPDQSRWEGRRDRVLMLLAVQTGLRVSELTGLNCSRRHPGHRRQRPLRRQGTQTTRSPTHQPRRGTAAESGCAERAGRPNDPLFPTRTGRRLSRDAVALRVSTHAAAAAQRCPSLLGKKVHPHVLRHSCAMSLLQAGVDTSVIALWLGHAGVRSTDAYLHADISIKEKALALTTPAQARPGRYRPTDKVLAFLESL